MKRNLIYQMLLATFCAMTTTLISCQQEEIVIIGGDGCAEIPEYIPLELSMQTTTPENFEITTDTLSNGILTYNVTVKNLSGAIVFQSVDELPYAEIYDCDGHRYASRERWFGYTGIDHYTSFLQHESEWCALFIEKRTLRCDFKLFDGDLDPEGYRVELHSEGDRHEWPTAYIYIKPEKAE